MEETNATEAEAVEVETAELETEEVEDTDIESVETEIVEGEAAVADSEETEASDAETQETEIVEAAEVEPIVEEPGAELAPTSIDEIAPKMKLDGKVSRLELYGAFIDIGVGTNALIHISKLGKEHVNRVSDALQVGEVVSVWVEKVNPEQGQIMVTMVEPLAVDWSDLKKGQTYTGTVTRLEKYGAFIDIGAEREGLVHISEISHEYVKHPSEMLSVGDEVQVQVLDFSKRKRRIDLSIKNLLEKPESMKAVVVDTYASVEEDDLEEELEDVPTAMEVALRRAMGDEPIDAIEGQNKRRRRKGRHNRRRRDQDDLLDRTMQFQHDS